MRKQWWTSLVTSVCLISLTWIMMYHHSPSLTQHQSRPVRLRRDNWLIFSKNAKNIMWESISLKILQISWSNWKLFLSIRGRHSDYFLKRFRKKSPDRRLSSRPKTVNWRRPRHLWPTFWIISESFRSLKRWSQILIKDSRTIQMPVVMLIKKTTHRLTWFLQVTIPIWARLQVWSTPKILKGSRNSCSEPPKVNHLYSNKTTTWTNNPLLDNRNMFILLCTGLEIQCVIESIEFATHS